MDLSPFPLSGRVPAVAIIRSQNIKGVLALEMYCQFLSKEVVPVSTAIPAMCNGVHFTIF